MSNEDTVKVLRLLMQNLRVMPHPEMVAMNIDVPPRIKTLTEIMYDIETAFRRRNNEII